MDKLEFFVGNIEYDDLREGRILFIEGNTLVYFVYNT